MQIAKKSLKNHYRLKKPCANCPFRRDDKAIELNPSRLKNIIDNLIEDDYSTFHCHKTTHRTEYSGWLEDEDGNTEYKASGKESMCAGAANYLLKLGRPTVGMRVAHAIGVVHFDEYKKFMDLVIDDINIKP